MTDATNSVVIERALAAAPGAVWQLWADPEQFRRWYGPQGARIPVAEFDLRVGGRRHVSMEMDTPNGTMVMWFVGEFRELVENERLVYTESMSDETGRVIPPAEMGMPADHPDVTDVIVEFAEAGGGTNLTLTHVGVPADSGGAMGWAMALDKLEALLVG